MTPTTTTAGELELAGWRRQVAEPYATIRQTPLRRRDTRYASPVATGRPGPAWVSSSARPRSCTAMAREMTTHQVRDFLGHRTRTAKVATVMQDGRPHVMPVWFVLDGEQLLLTTGADSVKGRNLRRDPRIAVLVDDETPSA